jgi:hypothetical protein
MKVQMFPTLDKAKPDIGNIRGLNLAADSNSDGNISHSYTYIKTTMQQRVYSASNHQARRYGINLGSGL